MRIDEVYAERNLVVQLAARLAQEIGYPVRWGFDPDEPTWPVLFIDLPTGQVSWHIPQQEAHLQAPAGGDWDGAHHGSKTCARVGLCAHPGDVHSTF